MIAPEDKDELDHLRRMLAFGLKHKEEDSERAFDGDDAEEWQRRSEEQGAE